MSIEMTLTRTGLFLTLGVALLKQDIQMAQHVQNLYCQLELDESKIFFSLLAILKNQGKMCSKSNCKQNQKILKKKCRSNKMFHSSQNEMFWFDTETFKIFFT